MENTKSKSDYKMTRNPFINFLCDVRLKNPYKKVTEVARDGAAIWNTMSVAEKEPYYEMGRSAPNRTGK
ncbi:hypothetical protein RN001_003048 [Aquatica leii]|uniref:HMG box domain-containing protein n=1 Tax=Aquatica leii TaxID=1421715 RepID=A0AAN7Q958_9COLE|nr:hypothetical protein RN001_003048 [Aquatica leii]